MRLDEVDQMAERARTYADTALEADAVTVRVVLTRTRQESRSLSTEQREIDRTAWGRCSAALMGGYLRRVDEETALLLRACSSSDERLALIQAWCDADAARRAERAALWSGATAGSGMSLGHHDD